MSNYIQLEEIKKEIKQLKQDINKIGVLISLTLLCVCILIMKI